MADLSDILSQIRSAKIDNAPDSDSSDNSASSAPQASDSQDSSSNGQSVSPADLLAQYQALKTTTTPTAQDSEEQGSDNNSAQPDQSNQQQQAQQPDDQSQNQTPAQQALKAALQMPQGLSDDDLKAAQGSQQDQVKRAMLQAAFNKIGHAISRSQQPLDNSFTDQLIKQAGMPVNDILQRRQAFGDQLKTQQTMDALKDSEDAQDPNSKISKMYQDFAKNRLGMKVDGASASQLSALTPLVMKDKEFQENVAMRQQVAEQNRLMRQDALGKKNDEANYKHLQQAQQDLNLKDKAYVTAKSGVDAAEEAKQALDQAMSNPTAANAIPIVMARLATHGQRINQTEIHSLTGGQDISDVAQRYAKKLSQGTMTTNDYNNFDKLINTYKKSSLQDMQKHEQSAAARLSQLNGKDVNDNYRDLTGHDMDDSLNQPAAAGSQDPKIAQYAQQHDLQYDAAKTLLVNRGYKPQEQ